jgi:hypothetical protein
MVPTIAKQQLPLQFVNRQTLCATQAKPYVRPTAPMCDPLPDMRGYRQTHLYTKSYTDQSHIIHAQTRCVMNCTEIG